MNGKYSLLAGCALAAGSVISLVSIADTMQMPGTVPAGQGDQRQEYVVQLNPLNPGISANGSVASGTARVIVDGDQFGVVMDLSGLDPNMPHMAHIHKGDRCPTSADDANGDGVVDVIEGVPAYGPIMINLDGDLSTFAGGSTTYFPVADSLGQSTYIGSGSVKSLVGDLRRAAPDPKTGVGVLGPNEFLDLSKAHIVVHGVAPSVQLPAGTQTVTGLTPNQSLPVACGQLQLVNRGQLTQSTMLGAPAPAPSASPSPTPSAPMSMAR